MTTIQSGGDGTVTPRPRAAASSPALASIDAWLDTSPSLRAMDDDRFLQALEAFEGSSDQRAQIARRLARAPAPAPATCDDGLRWLSIGCGGGDLDAMVARAFARDHDRQNYVGVDPNPVECARCRELFEALPGAIASTVVALPFEDFRDEASSYDLIYAAHTFYYVEDVERAVAAIERLLRPGGKLVVLQAPLGALNQLANRFWEARLGRSVPYSATVEQRLRALRPSIDRFRIEADLDVTSCVAPAMDDHGRAVLDFILQLDTAALPSQIQDQARSYLRSISRREGGRWLAPHPVDGFVLQA